MSDDWRDDPEVQCEIAVDRLYVDVSEHIAEAMEDRGMNRSQLAELCGVTKGAMTQRLSAKNLTLKTVATTLHQLGFGLEVALVDRQNKNRVTRLRDYETEYVHEHSANVVHLNGVPWGRTAAVPDTRSTGVAARWGN